jgi:hypothetical protein
MIRRYEMRGTTMPGTVLYQAADAIATITLNRPGAMNALTAEMKGDLLAALRRAATGPARAVIITGNGRGFCAGQDLREHVALLESGATATDTVREHYNPLVTEIMTMPKPVIAAVNGVARARARLSPWPATSGWRPGRRAWRRAAAIGTATNRQRNAKDLALFIPKRCDAGIYCGLAAPTGQPSSPRLPRHGCRLP